MEWCQILGALQFAARLPACHGSFPAFGPESTWRFMGTYSHSDKSTYNLVRGLRGLLSTAIIRVISTLNLQVV